MNKLRSLAGKAQGKILNIVSFVVFFIMAKGVTLEKVYDKLPEIESEMATKKKVDELIETIDIVSNPEIMKKIKQSENDIKKGKTKKVSSVKDMLEEFE